MRQKRTLDLEGVSMKTPEYRRVKRADPTEAQEVKEEIVSGAEDKNPYELDLDNPSSPDVLIDISHWHRTETIPRSRQVYLSQPIDINVYSSDDSANSWREIHVQIRDSMRESLIRETSRIQREREARELRDEMARQYADALSAAFGIEPELLYPFIGPMARVSADMAAAYGSFSTTMTEAWEAISSAMSGSFQNLLDTFTSISEGIAQILGDTCKKGKPFSRDISPQQEYERSPSGLSRYNHKPIRNRSPGE